jgi:adenylate cyclase
VRFEARRLRRDLDTYYVDAGVRDPVRITIPKGHYVPQFKWHQAPTDAPPADDTEREAGAGTVVRATGAAVDARTVGANVARLRVRALAALIAVALVAAAVGAWLWLRSPPTSSPEAARGPAVIVLPFEALSTGEDFRFLASGMTQEVITALMRFEGFRLYSVPASFNQAEGADPMTLGNDLGVGYVVKGSVSADATTVRVAAQLFNAQTGRVIWSETYDQAPTRSALLGIRTELAGSIATVLGQPYGVLNRDMAARLATGVEPSMASYACVLQAHEYRRTFRDELRQRVLACLDAAVQRDPDYAEPWAMLGWLHLDAARFGFVPDAEFPRELGQALDFASKAVAINPENVIALRALSAVQYHLGNFDEAERIQRRRWRSTQTTPIRWRSSVGGWPFAAAGRRVSPIASVRSRAP